VVINWNKLNHIQYVKPVLKNPYFHIFLFLFLYACFYFGSLAFTGLTVPGGHYLPWLDQYFDFVSPFRKLLLEGAAMVTQMFGYEPLVFDYHIRFKSGGGVQLIYACLGFAVFSFWWAMIIAFPQTTRNKLIYFAAGTVIIIILNIIRIAAVAMVFASKWGREHSSFDHHLVFNLVVYGILFYMLYRWFNIPEKPRVSTAPPSSSNTEGVE
jgi:exosortase/archaeosortase family protein